MTLKTLFCAMAALGASAQAAEFKPVANVDLKGGYAATVGSSSAGLALLDLNFVPALKLGNRSILPTIYAGTAGQERSIAEGTTFVRSAKAGFKPSLLTELDGGYSYTLRLSSQRDWNLETLGETWGTGLYDYDQFGGGASVGLPADLLGFSLSAGADFGHRNYPNYRNSAAAAALTGNMNYYTKDYWVTNGELVLGFGVLGLELAYRPEYHAFTDSYIVVTGGTTDLKQLQQEWLHSLDLNFSLPLAEGLPLSVGLNVSINDSNQSSFDLAANRFIQDVEDYWTESLTLGLPLKADSLVAGLGVNLGYNLLLRQTPKPVQSAGGAYTDAKQSDMEHSFSLGLAQALPWGLRWLTDGSFRLVRSNQDFARGTLNNYEHWQVTTGLSWSFVPAEGGASEGGVDAGEDEEGPDEDPEFSGAPEADDEGEGGLTADRGSSDTASAPVQPVEAEAATVAAAPVAAVGAVGALADAAAGAEEASVIPSPTPEVIEQRKDLECAELLSGDSQADELGRFACEMKSVAGADQVLAERNEKGEVLLRFTSGALRFGANSGVLSASDEALLDKVSALLQKQPKVKVAVIGYTDTSGDAAVNRRVAEERAKSVAVRLRSAGVEGGQIARVEGLGPVRPVASNATEEGRAANRRVELLLLR